MRRYLVAGLVAASAGLAQASDFSYNYLEGGFGEVDKGDAIFIGGSKAVDKNLYLLGHVQAIDMKHDVDGYYLSGGVGYHVPLTATADAFADVRLLYANVDFPGGDKDDFGAIGRVGVRVMPVQKVELEGSLSASSNDLLVDDGLGFTVAGRYHFDSNLSAALGYSHETELDGAFVNVRYGFR